MSELVKAKEPFQFYSRLHLLELTGLRASNLSDLLENIKIVPGSCIYYHTHRFLQQHQYLSPEPPNDFAYWVTQVLGDNELGESLAGIDTIQFKTIRELRNKIAETIEEHLKNRPRAKQKFAEQSLEFHFIKSISFIFPTEYVATDLQEFSDILQKISIDSIYFHMFEARLRLEKGTNDFSVWIDTSLGDKKLAQRISKLDPYTYTMEDLRKTIIKIIESRTV
jgi:hypothetical protein